MHINSKIFKKLLIKENLEQYLKKQSKEPNFAAFGKIKITLRSILSEKQLK